ncbi:hypothetical protein O181_024780 [Austropuccinia psidii MF-1]|uniref:Uncharacterized protein n=1 Tax=Austropuccinia psidii MF-1 TaxID=1389203 RepID=A0A9Q3H0G2_9BASI|nr:hypothetical protein [Austropuccinia psidii MF-1]
MSSKLTELTESSPSVQPLYVLCGSGILSQLASPWSMASSGQTYDGYKALNFCFVGKKPCCHYGQLASNVRRFLWSKKDGPFGKEFAVSEAPTPDGTSGPSPSHTPEKRFQSHIIPSTPRTFQPTLATLPASPSSSTARPALIPAVRPSPIVISQQLQPVASSSIRREELSAFPFPAAQVFQQRDCWPIQVTIEDPNTASENQDSVARLFGQVDRNSREVIMYANDRTIPGTSSKGMAEKLSWYEDELINDFQRTFDHIGRDN